MYNNYHNDMAIIIHFLHLIYYASMGILFLLEQQSNL